MRFFPGLVPALTVACVAVSPATWAEEPASARPPVDARVMLPSIAAPEPVVAPSPGSAGLTRNQRKDAALKARQEGVLRPAGEGAELREEPAAALVTAGKDRPGALSEARAPQALATPPTPSSQAASAPGAKKQSVTKTAAARPRPANRKTAKHPPVPTS